MRTNDGSLAAVNTQTKLAVRIEPEVRQVTLGQGEVWFQVAKDRARAFIVEAGEARVRAVGTAFSVRRTDTGADIRVTEGIVEIWNLGNEANTRRIGAGTRAIIEDNAVVAPVIVANADIERALTWRNGELVFEGDTVAEAAAEFNRYNSIKIQVANSKLAGEKVIGRFRTNEPDAFAHAIASLFGATVETQGSQIILSVADRSKS